MSSSKRKKGHLRMYLYPLLILGNFLWFIECLQYIIGEKPLNVCILHLITSVTYVILISVLRFNAIRFMTIFLLIFEFINSFSWLYAHIPINQGIIDLMKPVEAFAFIKANGFKGFIWQACLVVALLTFFLTFPFISTYPSIRIPQNKYIFSFFLGCIIFFMFYTHLAKNYRPIYYNTKFFSIKDNIWPPMYAQLKSFDLPVNVSFNSNKRKNIIILVIESLEQQCIGRYNPRYPNVMPFMNSIIDQHAHASNVVVQKYQTWSVGSFFGAFCNMPCVVTSKHLDSNKGKIFDKIKKMNCLGDFLEAAGYNNLLFGSVDMRFGGLKNIFARHGFNTIVSWGSVPHDTQLYYRLENIEVPALAASKKPFCLVIMTSDTHPFFKSECNVRKNVSMKKLSAHFSAFDCADQFAEHFINVLKKYKMDENTEVIIYGDHPIMGHYSEFKRERQLIYLFPFKDKQIIKKKTSIYDLSPTVLSLLGINYSPKYIYGADLFSDKIGLTPNEEDFGTLFETFNID